MPIIVASQGGPKQHLARFKDRGVTWLHVTASPEHASKAEAAGVDACRCRRHGSGRPSAAERGRHLGGGARGGQGGALPVIAGGGVADGAGIAAMFCLGAEAVQLGTRFLRRPNRACTRTTSSARSPPASRTPRWSGRGKLPIRALKNEFTREFEAAERAGMPAEELATLERQPYLEDGGARRRRRAGQGRGRAERRPDRRASLPAAEIVRAAGGRVRAGSRAAVPVPQ